MVEKSRPPRLMVIEGDVKLESKRATPMSMDSLLRFAQEIARIENTTYENTEKKSDSDRLFKVASTDFVALSVPALLTEEKKARKKSAEKK